MALIKRDGLPEFWVTGLSKILVGDQPCRLEAWTKAHFKVPSRERSGNFAQWKVDHTAQLQAATERLTADGWTCQVEQYLKLRGQSAVIVGKADLITRKDGERPVIRDIKTGQPSDAHVLQVLIEMVICPLVWDKAMIFNGEVIYATHTVSVTAAEAEAIKGQLFTVVRALAQDTTPEALPSATSCRFCDLAETCPAHWQEPTDVPRTELF